MTRKMSTAVCIVVENLPVPSPTDAAYGGKHVHYGMQDIEYPLSVPRERAFSAAYEAL